MTRNTAITVLMLAALTTGCTVKGPSVKVAVPGVEVGIQSGNVHCPPGQGQRRCHAGCTRYRKSQSRRQLEQRFYVRAVITLELIWRQVVADR